MAGQEGGECQTDLSVKILFAKGATHHGLDEGTHGCFFMHRKVESFRYCDGFPGVRRFVGEFP